MVDDKRSTQGEGAQPDAGGAFEGGRMRSGLDREYESMGTGEAGGGVGGGGASSSDVEWDAGGGSDDAADQLAFEETAGGAMANEQEFADDSDA